MLSVRYPEKKNLHGKFAVLMYDAIIKMGKQSCEAFAAHTTHSSMMLRVQWTAPVWDARTRLAESISDFHKLSIRTFVHWPPHAHPRVSYSMLTLR